VLHLQLRVPPGLTEKVVEVLTRDDTVTNVAVFENGYSKPPGALVLADVAREGANPVIAALREMNLQHDGSIMLSEPSTILSDAVVEAEVAAPGEPDDGVVWDIVENRVRSESKLTWSYISFLTLATLIAGTGRLLDQPILIVGAMVVGPEFSPVAAICVALARPRPSLLPRALRTLVLGFLIALAIAAPLWFVGTLIGLVSPEDAASGELTKFIISPDIWSFVIALLAGVAGVLSLTTSKSGPLVGVFISVTTVPAAGDVSLALALGHREELVLAATQLGINLVGILVAALATLALQRRIWRRLPGLTPRFAASGRHGTIER
jgi:uncharacterized hydrophobic protein (TIGR00271 family)